MFKKETGMRQLQVSAREEGQRLDRYLEKYMPQAQKSFFYKMLRKKNITLNGRKAAGNERLQEGDTVTLFLAEDTVEKFREGKGSSFRMTGQEKKLAMPPVIYEDEELLVFNKPQGMLSQKAGKEDVSLVECMTEYLLGDGAFDTTFRPGICNRLDRNTTGLVMAGKTVGSLQYLNRLFKERALEKYYLCLVQGRVEEAARVDGYLVKDEVHNRVTVSREGRKGAARIITAYVPVAGGYLQGQAYTLLQVELITGKSHQIRAHLQSIGHPVAGDAKYGEKAVCQLFRREFGIQYQLLHAWRLRLGHPEYLPEKYRGMEFTAPLPEHFIRALKGVGIREWESL